MPLPIIATRARSAVQTSLATAWLMFVMGACVVTGIDEVFGGSPLEHQSSTAPPLINDSSQDLDNLYWENFLTGFEEHRNRFGLGLLLTHEKPFRVIATSPLAASQGLFVGDYIISVDKKPPDAFRGEGGPWTGQDKTRTFLVRRGENELSLDLTPGDLPKFYREIRELVEQKEWREAALEWKRLSADPLCPALLTLTQAMDFQLHIKAYGPLDSYLPLLVGAQAQEWLRICEEANSNYYFRDYRDNILGAGHLLSNFRSETGFPYRFKGEDILNRLSSLEEKFKSADI